MKTLSIAIYLLGVPRSMMATMMATKKLVKMCWRLFSVKAITRVDAATIDVGSGTEPLDVLPMLLHLHTHTKWPQELTEASLIVRAKKKRGESVSTMQLIHCDVE